MKTKIVLLFALILAPAIIQAQAPTYVAIGDSLAFGYQQDKFIFLLITGQYSPTLFNTGFVDTIDGFLRTVVPNLQTVNFSCPGETTTTLVFGGCPFHSGLFVFPLHTDYPGYVPQIGAAFQYIMAHPGETQFITITIGANDMLNLLSDCGREPTCMAQNLPGVTANATTTLGNVVDVLNLIAPGALKVYTNVPDPYMYQDPSTVPYFQSFNAAMGTVAIQKGMKVADWFNATGQFDQATFCQLTFVCSSGDIHPTDLGYKVLGYYTILSMSQ